MTLSKEKFNKWIQLKCDVKKASHAVYTSKNKLTETAFDAAIEKLCDYEKTHNIPLMATEAELEPQTNEEWFISLPSAEKAKVFGAMLFEALKDGLAEEIHDKRFYENLIEFWLAEEHKS